MADPLELELLIYDPTDPEDPDAPPLAEGYVRDPIPSGKAGVDSNNFTIKISLDDVPTDNGGYLEIFTVTKFIRESAINDKLAKEFVFALQGASEDGLIEDFERRPEIITEYEAKLSAMSNLDFKTQSNFQLSITLTTTNFFEFEVGDQLRFIDEAEGINILIVIQSIDAELNSTVGLVDEWKFSMNCSPYVINQSLLIAQLIGLSLFPRKKKPVELGPDPNDPVDDNL